MAPQRNTKLLNAISSILLQLRNAPQSDGFEQYKLSQRDVAEMAGMSLNYYRELEHGIKMPTLEKLLQIAEAHGVTLTQLVEKIEIKYNNNKI